MQAHIRIWQKDKELDSTIARGVTSAAGAWRKRSRIVMLLLAMSLGSLPYAPAQQHLPDPAAYDIEDLGSLGAKQKRVASTSLDGASTTETCGPLS